MRVAADRVLAGLPPATRDKATRSFDDRDRTDWHYTPRSRNGVAHFTLLIEYDSTHNGGNHIHSVWRDFNGDFGRDLLREHYQGAKGTPHKH